MQDLTSWYLKQISRTPLLTGEQELMLGRQVQAWIKLKEIGWDNLDKSQKRQFKLGERAYQKFMQANLKLVVTVAKKYVTIAKTMEFADLISEGNIGLARAVEKFDPERGYKFSTYAYWWIRQSIHRSLSVQDRTIRMPGHAHDSLSKIRRFSREFAHAHGYMPSREQICEELNIARETLDSYLLHDRGCRSLNEQVNGEEGSALIELVADPNQNVDDFLDDIHKHQVYDLVHQLTPQLPPKQEEVIQLRFFNQEQEITPIKTLGLQMNCHRDSAHKHLKGALKTLGQKIVSQVGHPHKAA